MNGSLWRKQRKKQALDKIQAATGVTYEFDGENETSWMRAGSVDLDGTWYPAGFTWSQFASSSGGDVVIVLMFTIRWHLRESAGVALWSSIKGTEHHIRRDRTDSFGGNRMLKNNGIVLVTTTNQLQAQGLSKSRMRHDEFDSYSSVMTNRSDRF